LGQRPGALLDGSESGSDHLPERSGPGTLELAAVGGVPPFAVVAAAAFVVTAVVVRAAPLDTVHRRRRGALDPRRSRRDREQNQGEAEGAGRHDVIRL
jgi:hypothetical protein